MALIIKRRRANSVSGAIKSIAVRGLFGQFDYDLSTGVDGSLRSHGKVFILYGDNGAGKTTILNLLFHALSPANNKGHRNAIAKVPFRELAITLQDDTVIRFIRTGSLTGGYAVEISRGNKLLMRADFNLSREKGFDSEDGEKSFISFLRELNPGIHFLSADRRLNSDIFEEDEESAERHFLIQKSLHDHMLRSGIPPGIRENVLTERAESSVTVTRAIRQAERWIGKQNLRATQRGTESSHNLYSEIVTQISASRDSAPASSSDEMKATLRGLAKRSAEYAKYGFTNALQVENMVKAVENASKSSLSIIENVLKPYIDGTNARLDQLKELHSLTEIFIRNINSFYRNKVVSFDLNHGFRISVDNGTILDPEKLSSGEKQLMLLFCHTLISNGSQSIFIIDEPELSLNVKWQRGILRALLEIVRSGSVQFILATHSIELLSDHMARVAKLESSKPLTVQGPGEAELVSEQDS